MPRLSLIVPFEDARKDVRYLASFTQRQDCPHKDYEVIVITRRGAHQVDREVQKILRSQDRLVHATGNRFEFYNVGAKVATGKFLLLSEDHVIAASSFLSEVLRFCDQGEYDAGFVACGHVARNRVSRTEGRVYDRLLLDDWLRADHWNRVRLRGFVLRRDLFDRIGGIPGEFNTFCESLTAARLHQAGARIGYVAGARLQHVNQPTLRDIGQEIYDYAWNEFRFREQANSSFCEEYFGLPEEWTRRQASSLRQDAWDSASITDFLGTYGEQLNSQDRALFERAAGPRPPLVGHGLGARLRAWWDVKWAEFRFWTARSEELQDRRYREHWHSVVRLARLRYLAAHPPGPSVVGSDLELANAAPHEIAGFHQSERWNDIRFRWSSPVASVKLRRPAGAATLVIDTASLRGSDCDFLFAIYLNGERIPGSHIKRGRGLIHAELPDALLDGSSADELQVTILCPPVRPDDGSPLDTRMIGLPVVSVRIEAASTSIAAADSSWSGPAEAA